MKKQIAILASKAILLVVASFSFAGCTIVNYFCILLRNTTSQPVDTRLSFRERVRLGDTLHTTYRTFFAREFAYAPAIIKPGKAALNKLSARLPAVATDTAVTFTIPPYSTVRLFGGIAYGFIPLPERMRLSFQKPGLPAQVVDSAQFVQAAQKKLLGGLQFWYDID